MNAPLFCRVTLMTQDDDNSESGSISKRLFGRELPLETETSWFILVSLLDVLMTWFLLSQGGRFYESNPVARWFIYGWGVKGMVYFKFGMVAFICVITQIIALKRPETAKGILYLGTTVVAGVVIYSLTLALRG